jgi:hypothetical protein
VIFALASGTLFRHPESKISKAGKPFAVATLKVRDGDSFSFVKLLVFSESAQAELMRLTDGDALSAQGSLKAETYDKNGETRISLTIIADQVLAVRAERKKKEKLAAAPPDNPSPHPAPDRSRMNRYGGDGVDHFHDEIPF